MCSDEMGIAVWSSQTSPDYLPQGQMDMYMYEDAMVSDMHKVIQRSNFFGGSVMVLGGISHDTRIDLNFFDSGSVNTSIYMWLFL